MAFIPCNSGLNCRSCTANKWVWADLAANNTQCCFQNASDMESITWAAGTPDDCPAEAHNYGALAYGLVLGVCILIFGMGLVWFWARIWTAKEIGVPVVFPPGEGEAENDDEQDSGSGGSELLLSTTESDADEQAGGAPDEVVH